MLKMLLCCNSCTDCCNSMNCTPLIICTTIIIAFIILAIIHITISMNKTKRKEIESKKEIEKKKSEITKGLTENLKAYKATNDSLASIDENVKEINKKMDNLLKEKK